MAFSDILRGALPDILRSGIVAAASPTPGHVGTAQDIFGGIMAAGADRQKQDLLRDQMRRQAVQDAMKQQEFEQEMRTQRARENQFKAQANRYNTMAQNGGAKPGKDYAGIIKNHESLLGRPLTEREKRTVLGLAQMESDMRKPAVPQKLSGILAQQIGALDKESPTYAEDLTTLQKMHAEALEKEQGSPFGQARKPFVRPQIVQGAKGPLFVQPPDKLAPGTSAPVKDEEGMRLPPKPEKKSPFKTTAADRSQNLKEKVSAVGNALIQENGGDRQKAAAAALADPRAKGIVKEVQDWLVPPQKGKAEKPSLLDAIRQSRQGSAAAPAKKADPLGIR